jgi:hypothetical protein
VDILEIEDAASIQRYTCKKYCYKLAAE